MFGLWFQMSCLSRIDTNFSLSDEDEHLKKLNSGRVASGRNERWKADFLQDLKYELEGTAEQDIPDVVMEKVLSCVTLSMDRIRFACP